MFTHRAVWGPPYLTTVLVPLVPNLVPKLIGTNLLGLLISALPISAMEGLAVLAPLSLGRGAGR